MAAARRRLLAAALLGLGAGEEAPVGCAAGQACRLPGYAWSTKNGDARQSGASPYAAPWELSASRAWGWRNPFHVHMSMPIGTPLIDDELNIYAHDLGGWIHKFTASGGLLWSYGTQGTSHHQPALWNGSLFGTADPGSVFRVDMRTGQELWRARVGAGFGGDGSSVLAHDGLVITPTVPYSADPWQNRDLVALSAADGREVWRFRTQGPMYNTMPCTARNRLIFADGWGGVYCLDFATGSLLWTNFNFYRANTFTTGNAMLGANDVFYTASNFVGGTDFQPTLGSLHACNLSDGATLWSREFTEAVQAAPAVGSLGPGQGLSVVLGIGENTGLPPLVTSFPAYVPPAVKRALNRLSIRLGAWARFLWWRRPWHGHRIHVQAFDAASGRPRWRFDAPTWWRPTCAGDEERLESVWAGLSIPGGSREICTCDAWSNPSIGSDGTVYIGSAHGMLYALRDANGDGVVSGKAEVQEVDTGAALIMPPSIGPGILAAVTCNEVIVFRSGVQRGL